MNLTFAPADAGALPLHVIEAEALESWLADQPARVRTWVEASGFAGEIGNALMIPGESGAPGQSDPAENCASGGLEI